MNNSLLSVVTATLVALVAALVSTPASAGWLLATVGALVMVTRVVLDGSRRAMAPETIRRD